MCKYINNIFSLSYVVGFWCKEIIVWLNDNEKYSLVGYRKRIDLNEGNIGLKLK